MEKRYQIFVSSTYADLKQERQRVIQTLMELDCIPAGMELFPAADEEQWEFIKRVIDDCDYYLLIIGGRYGSTTTAGVSYTEKEYDYAIDKGLKVIALLHDKPDEIPVGKSDIEPELRIRLNAFREKVASNRLVKFWNKADDLPGLVALSISKTIKMFPAVGWVRANTVGNEELLSELNEIRKENNELKASLKEAEQQPLAKLEQLAGLDEKFVIRGTYFDRYRGNIKTDWKSTLTWKEIFAQIAPYLQKLPTDEYIKGALKKTLMERENGGGHSYELNDQDFQTIALQLKALGLINIKYLKTTSGGMALFWSLTPAGERMMMALRTVPPAK